MWAIFLTSRKDEFDDVFHAINNLKIELSPSKFLDTQFINVEGKHITKVHRKESKIPIHSSS